VRRTALIVDDDRAIVDGLGEYLEYDGYAVIGATNASEALALLDSGLRPDVIVLDLLMPDMDGWDFRTAQLNEPSLAAIPVLVISASGYSRQMVLTHLAVDDYLPKPLDPETVASVLDRLYAIRAALN
jgi:two-component system, chemotaxis family, chemotaxis protein CheY